MERKASNSYLHPDTLIAFASLIGSLATIAGIAATGKRSLLVLLLAPALLLAYHYRGSVGAR